MYIKGIVLSVLFFCVSLPVCAGECPSDNPLIDQHKIHWIGRNKNGERVGGWRSITECVSCDYEHPTTTTKANCDICPNREYRDGKCVLKQI